MKTTASIDLAALSEKQWTSQVKDLAALMGWMRYHTFLATRSPAGFPDEVLVRHGRMIFAELKRQPPRSKKDPERELLGSVHRLSDKQREWLDALARTGLVEVYAWVPSDYDEIALILRHGRETILDTPQSAWIPGYGRKDGRPL